MEERKTFLVISLLLVAASCGGTITVDSNDRTPPALAATLVAADQLHAAYSDDSERLRGRIETRREVGGREVGRPFGVTTTHDRKSVQILFTATDAESGVSALQGTMEVSFTCHLTIVDLDPLSKETMARFTQTGGRRVDPGGDASDRAHVLVELTLEDLWREGGCDVWEVGEGEFDDVHAGTIADIQVNYTAEATNNQRTIDPRAVTSPTSRLEGNFSIADADVRLRV